MQRGRRGARIVRIVDWLFTVVSAVPGGAMDCRAVYHFVLCGAISCLAPS